MSSRWTVVGLLGLLAVLASGCPAEEPQASTLRWTTCPDDVLTATVGEVECAYLAVPESRDTPGADRRVEVFVARMLLGAEPSSREPVLVTSLGSRPNYGGIAPLVQRVQRDVIIVDTRGVGHSRPSLECSEVQLLNDTWARPTDDPNGSGRLTDGIADCYDRLADAGIDVKAYNLTEAARDLEDLRHAMGISSWNVVSYGAGSRLALELLRIAPEPVRALVMDSPEVPGADPRALAGEETLTSVRAVLAACTRDRTCRRRYPDAPALVDRAMQTLRRDPLAFTAPRRNDQIRVVLDPTLLARGLRQLLSDSGSSGPFFSPTSVPEVLDAVVARDRVALRRFVGQLVRYDDGLCLGYRSKCLPAHSPSQGVELSILCRDIAPHAPASHGQAAARVPPGIPRRPLDGPVLALAGPTEYRLGRAPTRLGRTGAGHRRSLRPLHR